MRLGAAVTGRPTPHDRRSVCLIVRFEYFRDMSYADTSPLSRALRIVDTEEATMDATHGPLDWRKSRRCDSASCVEAAVTTERVGMRDGKSPDGPALWFSVEEWTAFIEGIKDGDFS
jgi:hypothetical protein